MTRTPNFSSRLSVIAIYGLLVKFVTRSSESPSQSGSAISRPVKNCDVIEPSIAVFPARSGPCTVNGGRPFAVTQATPRARSGCSSIASGRASSEPRPVSVTGCAERAAIAGNMRMQRPDSPQSRRVPGCRADGASVTRSGARVTSAPSVSTICSAASASSQYDGRSSSQAAPVKYAAATARSMSLFEDGAVIAPSMAAGRINFSINFPRKIRRAQGVVHDHQVGGLSVKRDAPRQ